MKMEKKLYRDRENGIFLGVCAGIAEYYNFDVNVVRLIALLLCWNVGLLFYFVAALVIPEKPSDENNYYNDEE